MRRKAREAMRRARSSPMPVGSDTPILERRVPSGESALDQYLEEVKKYAPISREEEVALARRARRGDREAIQKLVQANLRFVISVGKRYQGRGLPLSDLIQQGNLGLVTAATKFDPERGVKFISYAVWWIRQAIHTALAHHSRSFKIPLNRAAELSRIWRTRAELGAKLGREPSRAELAKRLGLDPEMVEWLEALSAGELRLDAPVGEGDTRTVGERLTVEETAPALEVERRLMSDEIEEALKALRDRDALVLKLYYGLGGEREHTLEEIGKILGVTRERVRQLRDRALRELREGKNRDVLAALGG